MTQFELINEWLGHGHPPEGWGMIGTRPLLIIVGVTGVGKTTTVNAMKKAGLSFTLLPNRRTLTDSLIIRTLQQQRNEPIQQITDREQRFAYTAAYRAQHPGGMAHALTQLFINTDINTDIDILLFDGLRGINEVAYAAEHLPNAHFLVLDAPHAVRVQRLLGRNDAFDAVRIDRDREGEIETVDRLVEGVGRLFSDEEAAGLLGLLDGGVTTNELTAKLKIVAAEAQNYDPAGTIEALQNVAPERTILIDTTQHRPDEIAQIVINRV